MTLKFEEINWIAVLVAGLGTFLLGGVWYTALFGKLWVRLMGFSEEQVKKMQAEMKPPVFFGSMIICYLVLAVAIAILVTAFDVKGWHGGAVLGALLWIGPAAAIQWTGHISEGKRFGVYLINLTYQLIYLVGMGALLAVWR
jgi:hypothetical protein